MINIEKLHKMYEGIIDGSELLTKDLRSFGFSKREINELLSKKILVRVQKGIYDLTTVDNLFLYGIDLKNNGDRQRGLQCIKKCYEIDPTHIKVCLRLFKEALLDENVEESISYIKEIDVNDFINKMYEKLKITNEVSEQKFTYITKGVENSVYIHNKSSNLTVGSLQDFIDYYLKEYGGTVDYIHGTDIVRKLSEDKNSIGFILDDMDKKDLFPTVIADGSLPRKTFSMGHAEDKR